MTLETPKLRIVSDDLWNAAHARLEVTRETYLRSQNGQLWGRPLSGVASKYLLTGIGRCAHCGAGLEVRSRSHGRRRIYFYSCSSYYRGGKAVCPNRYEIPMKLQFEHLLAGSAAPVHPAQCAEEVLGDRASCKEL